MPKEKDTTQQYNINKRKIPARLFSLIFFSASLIVLIMKRVEDYTVFYRSPERDVRREIAEIISLFRKEFATAMKTTLFLPPSTIHRTVILRAAARSSNLTSFARGRLKAKVKAKARRRATLGKTFNELFCIAMPRPRYRLSTRSWLLSRIKEYLPHSHVYVT